MVPCCALLSRLDARKFVLWARYANGSIQISSKQKKDLSFFGNKGTKGYIKIQKYKTLEVGFGLNIHMRKL